VPLAVGLGAAGLLALVIALVVTSDSPGSFPGLERVPRRPGLPCTLKSASGHDVVFAPPRLDRMAGELYERFHEELVEQGRLVAARNGYLARYPSRALYRVDGLQPGVE